MTRNEFDARFAATLDNTEGYTQRQLDVLNGLVFDTVADFDPDSRNVKSLVDYVFARASTHYAVHVAY